MLSPNIIYQEYIVGKNSTSAIAKKYNTYPNMVRRAIIKYGYKLRDKSEAQKIAIKSGRHPHPTKGTKHSSDTKLKISNSLAEDWENMSESQYNERVKAGKKSWKSLTNNKKQAIKSAAAKGIKRASINGSKLEKVIMLALIKMGYKVEFHKDDLLTNEKLQIDLFVPKLGLAIEVDGPSHFLPIWGENKLEKHKRADKEKNGLLLAKGFRVLRIKYSCSKLSQKVSRNAIDKINAIISNLVNKPIVPELIECEV